MRKTTVAKHLFALVALILPLYCGAVTINDVEMPDTYAWEGKELKLMGAGTRSKWFMDLYVAGLYLTEESGKAKAILEADEPQRIALQITSGMITSERMTEAVLEGFETSTGGNTAPIQPDIDRFIGVFDEPIKEGDEFSLVYVPGKGVNVLKNGKYQDTIGDLAFKQALFGIWLAETPVDDDLKSELLGQR
ncbi:chalcone isomerase family protein [Marinobacter persicus]|uniref:Chalcone isomerase-like protein n=1 Tax=Marinobacter persicus TaxID=930118 RepID=A0A2S6G6E3_9GAMM|nr:chalcone isomerase family protein [Marinobacter persicus]PPK51546.1 chalcone isomerase-like protein [Marinobacter persicus]PPK54706.1 chalcone isomerase-like protein [Marinobacter persicus]PPK58251.1 chalcone isomerase-like protein [Marinobacter persicus]